MVFAGKFRISEFVQTFIINCFKLLRTTDIGYICDCAKDFQGQNCTKKVNTQLFSGVQLYFDHVTPVNTAQKLLVVLEQLGETNCTLELNTHNYAMLSVTIPTDGLMAFQYSENISKTARELGIRKWSNIHQNAGFFLVLNSTIVSRGRSMLNLIITDPITDNAYFDWYFEQFSTLNEETTCYPRISLPAWQIFRYSYHIFHFYHLHFIIIAHVSASPSNPTWIRIDRFFVFQAVVFHGCGEKSELKFSWTVSNFMETSKLLLSF